MSEISRQRRFEILGELKGTLCVCGTPKRPDDIPLPELLLRVATSNAGSTLS